MRMTYSRFILLIFCIITLSCDSKDIKIETEKSTKDSDSSITKIEEDITLEKSKFELSDYYTENDTLNKKVDLIFSKLSDPERVGQMIVSSAGVYGKSKNEVTKLIKEKKIGGVLLLKGSKNEFQGYINDFEITRKESGTLPLIYSCDAEPSLLNIKISGLPPVKKTNQINSVKESKEIANKISRNIKFIGFNQNFAPVCDLPYNKEIIGDRAFGEIEFTKAFIIETQRNSIIATAKHFPGHGNVIGDSHKSLVYVNGELKELSNFIDAIDAGVISVMVGHIAIKNNSQYNTEGKPSTLSRKIVTDLLKNKLNFKGIVITDAMNMGALNSFSTPSLSAVLAGCDMILMPSDETQLLNSIMEQMRKDENFKKQVYESVIKIIRAKVCLGLI